MNHNYWRLFLYGLLMYSLIACNFVDDIIKPEERFRPLETYTVGAEGAQITLKDAEIVIPEGVFNSDAELTVSKNILLRPFGEETYTPVYLIDGIPNDGEGSIKLCLKSKNYTSEEAEIMAGDYNMPKGTDSTLLNFINITTRDSAGFLVAEIYFKAEDEFKSSTLESTSQSQQRRRLYLTASKKKKSFVAGNFMIFYSDVDEDWLTENRKRELIKKVCIETYLRFENEEGYNFDMARYDNWPVRVLISNIDNDGEFVTHWFGSDYIAVKKSLVSDNFNHFESVFAHELLHLIQYGYYNFRNEDTDDEWFDEASATVIEKLHQFEPSTDYFPSTTRDNMGALFHGIINGYQYVLKDNSLKNRRKQGYANAAMLEYLLQKKYGENVLAREKAIRRLILGVSNGTSPLQLIENEYGKVEDWITDMYTSIYQRKLYGGNNEVITSVPMESRYRTAINTNIDNIYELTYSSAEFSAKVLTLFLQNLHDNCNITIKIPNDKFSSSQIEYLVFNSDANRSIIGNGFSENDSVFIPDFVNTLNIKEDMNRYILPLFVVNKNRQEGTKWFDISVRIENSEGPIIDRIEPSPVSRGSIISILGTNFNDNQDESTVTLNDETLAVTNWSDTEIQAEIPSYAESGNVFVTVKKMRSNGIYLNIDESSKVKWPSKYYCKEISFFSKVKCGPNLLDNITISGGITNETIQGSNGSYTFNSNNETQEATGVYNGVCEGLTTEHINVSSKQVVLKFKPDINSVDGTKGFITLEISSDYTVSKLYDSSKSSGSSSLNMLKLENMPYTMNSIDNPNIRIELSGNGSAADILQYLKLLQKQSSSYDCRGNIDEVTSCPATTSNIQTFFATIDLQKID